MMTKGVYCELETVFICYVKRATRLERQPASLKHMQCCGSSAPYSRQYATTNAFTALLQLSQPFSFSFCALSNYSAPQKTVLKFILSKFHTNLGLTTPVLCVTACLTISFQLQKFVHIKIKNRCATSVNKCTLKTAPQSHNVLEKQQELNVTIQNANHHKRLYQ
jgi:hypothetical protein